MTKRRGGKKKTKQELENEAMARRISEATGVPVRAVPARKGRTTLYFFGTPEERDEAEKGEDY